jgi:glucosylceramidase
MLQMFRTSFENGERIKDIGYASPSLEKSNCEIEVTPNERYQTVRGFGGAITEAAAYTLSQLPKDMREKVLQAYYSPRGGNCYQLGRVHINSCDFSLENYSYVEAHDKKLKTFDISRETRWVLPTIHQAQTIAGRSLFLLASPWSPPGWMKSNGDMNGGGTLRPEFRQVWADYYIRYLQAMAAQGIRIDAITVQNEPAAVQVWDSCLYTAAEERDFVRDYLGPTVVGSAFAGLKLLIWDHNRDLEFERAQQVLSDREAARYIWGVGHHWYESEEFENLSRLHNAYPEKHLVFTEGCQEGGPQIGKWFTGERYGRNIIGDMRNWVEGWIDWNIVLDEHGGPNHVDNYCDAPIIADTAAGEIHYNSSYWYIGHFSRIVLPGSVRIGSSEAEHTEGVHTLAFLTPNGELVVVVMNESETDTLVTLKEKTESKGLVCELPAHSIVTLKGTF